jgi:RNA polymerase sigma-70 factor (ECF subfamily)
MTSFESVSGLRIEVQAYFDQFSPAVLRLAHRITRNEADAEEVRQDVFLKLQERLPHLDPTGNMAGWLFRTATTLSLKLRQRRLRLMPDGKDELPRLDPRPPADDLECDGVKVGQALERLPEAQRRIILERFRDGRTPVQIAGRMGISAGNVRIQLFRAMEVLRQALRRMS